LDDSTDAVVARLLQAAAVNASALGDLDVAEDLLSRSVRHSSDPEDEGQAFAVAVVRIRQARYQEALDVIEPRCPSLVAETASPWLQLRAIALGEQGRFDEAEPFYAAAAPAAPETPAQVIRLLNLANVQAHKGKPAAAIENAVTVLARTSSRIAQTMAVHTIALAAASVTMTVDALALLIWHHEDLRTLGWTVFPGERAEWEQTQSQAASALTKSDLDAADARAAQLDVTTALDLAIEVANRFVTPASGRRPTL
jgi:tetratricopeptide (TPR) repeat protein